MLSSNLLKSKIPICGWGGDGGGWWNQFPTFDAESKFALKKIYFAKNFLSFRAKMCLGMVFDFEYRVVRYTKYSEPQKAETTSLSFRLNATHVFVRSQGFGWYHQIPHKRGAPKYLVSSHSS